MGKHYSSPRQYRNPLIPQKRRIPNYSNNQREKTNPPTRPRVGELEKFLDQHQNGVPHECKGNRGHEIALEAIRDEPEEVLPLNEFGCDPRSIHTYLEIIIHDPQKGMHRGIDAIILDYVGGNLILVEYKTRRTPSGRKKGRSQLRAFQKYLSRKFSWDPIVPVLCYGNFETEVQEFEDLE